MSPDAGPVITPREYATLFADAMRGVIGPRESDISRPEGLDAPAAPGALEELLRRVRRHPQDPAGHGMLAIAHLRAGHCRTAIRHLEIAVNLLLAQAATGRGLRCSLAERLELARLVPVLIPFCLELGKPDTARRLVGEVLLAW
jgi:hypothetical protein